MRYLDTNVLIRIITGDNQELAKKALAVIDAAGQNDLFIHDAVLVELCFVLEFHNYKMSRADICDAIQTLIDAPQIAVTKDSVTALRLYRKHPKLDYTDCLLMVLGGQQGVLTFDKELRTAFDIPALV